MKSTLLGVLVIVTLAGKSPAQYSPAIAAWPQVDLRISGEVSLRDLFAAGLSPYRFPGSGASIKIGVKHVQIRLIGENVEFPRLAVDWMDANVKQPHLITEANFRSPPLTINETRSEMAKWLPLTKKTNAELEAFLTAVKTDWLHYDTVNGIAHAVTFVDVMSEPNGLRYVLELEKAWHWDTPLRLRLTVDCHMMESRKRLKSYDGPVPPPPGYENVSMEAPANWGPDNPYTPLTDEPRSPRGSLPPGVKLYPDSLPEWNSPSSPKGKELNPNGPQSPPSATNEESTSLTLWSVVAVLIVAATGLLWLLLKKRH